MALSHDELNEAQRAAVTAGDGAHLVIAGAGTGKTRTLVHRVAHLIERGVPAAGIVLLTFTRRASTEMLGRVARMAGPSAHAVRGGTFHSFSNRTLRGYADLVGLTPSFTVLDRADAESLVGLIRGEVAGGGKGRRFPRKRTVLNVLSKASQTGREVEAILEAEYPQYAHEAEPIAEIGRRYAQRKRARDCVDFDDLLVLLAEVLKAHPEARRQIASSCHHVLVDEYQDTNRLQGLIAAMLATVHGNLMVVGDEAQSIYGFRGATVANILDFPSLFPGCTTITLEENYRSTQPVLDLANAVLASAAEGFDKRLRAVTDGGDVPWLVDVYDEHEQADVVVSEVLRLLEEGTGLDEQAVLFRSASHANLLEVALTEADIPYRKYGGLKFSEAAHIKDVFALLRLVVNPLDEVSWYRVLTWFDGVGSKTAQRLTAAALAAEPPGLDPEPHRKRKYYGDLVSLARVLDRCAALGEDVQGVLEQVVGYYGPLGPTLYDDWKKRARDLDTLPLLAERFDDLQRFVNEVALDPVDRADAEATEPPEEGVLTLSTIHSAKGLEWDAVTVLQLRDGSFPSGFALDDPEQVEEERRLFYVAVTRARQRLSLMCPRMVHGRGGFAFGPGCVLLEDLEDLERLVGRAVPHTVAGSGVDGLSDEGEVDEDLVDRLLGYFER